MRVHAAFLPSSPQLNYPEEALLEDGLNEHILGHLRNKDMCTGIIKDKCIKSHTKQKKTFLLPTPSSMINSSVGFPNIMWKIPNDYLCGDKVSLQAVGCLGLS